MDVKHDKIVCRGFSYECEIGFHACELEITQRIGIDLTAWVTPIPPAEAESESAIRFDYYEANRAIKNLCTASRFRLLETLSERVATLLLRSFAIHAIEVTVTKYPLSMPNAQSVSYVCYREKSELAEEPGKKTG